MKAADVSIDSPPLTPDQIATLAPFQSLIADALMGEGDSDRHTVSLFAMALACRGKTFIELGVRDGKTTLPLAMAAKLNGGMLHSVDIEASTSVLPEDLQGHQKFYQQDALEFLAAWDPANKVDFIYVDDWHAYEHVKKELEFIDRMIGPTSIVLVHDLMWGNTAPFYHCDLTIAEGQWADGGPYRAVAELPTNIWEWSTLPWSNGLTLLRKKYSKIYHPV